VIVSVVGHFVAVGHQLCSDLRMRRNRATENEKRRSMSPLCEVFADTPRVARIRAVVERQRKTAAAVTRARADAEDGGCLAEGADEVRPPASAPATLSAGVVPKRVSETRPMPAIPAPMPPQVSHVACLSTSGGRLERNGLRLLPHKDLVVQSFEAVDDERLRERFERPSPTRPAHRCP
jgi:hypothetical protein